VNIYVGNLSNEINEDDLREAFEAFGEVRSVNIIKDKFTGESRGFGFVRMPSREQAQTAISQLDSHTLKGAPIKVNEAHSPQGGGTRPGNFRGRSGPARGRTGSGRGRPGSGKGRNSRHRR